MALVLALKRGQAFYVGNEKLVVTKVLSEVDFDLHDPKTGVTHRITDRKAVEVFEDVFFSAGDRQQSSLARVAIEAPRNIRILRDEVYKTELEKGVNRMMHRREFKATPSAIEDALERGVEGNTEKRLERMAIRSAPITHHLGNRRFDDYVLNVTEDGVIESVRYMDEHV